MSDYPEFQTGEYSDQLGRVWRCIRKEDEGRMVCNSANGYFTVAGFETFKRWGWEHVTPVSPALCEGKPQETQNPDGTTTWTDNAGSETRVSFPSGDRSNG